MITLEQLPDCQIARVEADRIDAARAPQLRASLSDVGAGPARLILDVSSVEFIDSTGLGSLISVLKALGSGGELILAAPRPPVRRLLELTRLDQVIRTFPTLAEARNAGG